MFRKNLLTIIVLNIIIFCSLFIIIDYCWFRLYVIPTAKKYQVDTEHYKYTLFPKITYDWLKEHFNGQNNSWYGRKPDGLEFAKNGKLPIIIFGCSFAYGYLLEPTQTFSHKLAYLTKRPVYNRAITGASQAFMLYQLRNQDFYEQVPKSDTVIYIMINDHYRRCLAYTFNQFAWNQSCYLHYFLKDNDLILDTHKTNILKSSYLFSFFHHKYINNYALNEKNKENLTNLILQFFIQSRNELKKKWGDKINFVVIFYSHPKLLYEDLLKNKLEQNGFIVINTDDLTTKSLDECDYKLTTDNHHPNEAAWDLLTPLIVRELKNNNLL